LDFNGVEVSKIFWENLSGALNSSNSVEAAHDNNQLIICLINGEVWGYDFDEEQINARVEGYSEENIKFQRLLNEKKVLLNQLDKLNLEGTNKKKINANKTENSLKENVTVSIDLQSNSDDVSQ
jgi:hypothetical protein